MRILVPALIGSLLISTAYAQAPQNTPENQAFGATILDLTQSKLAVMVQLYRVQAELEALKAKHPDTPAKPAEPQKDK